MSTSYVQFGSGTNWVKDVTVESKSSLRETFLDAFRAAGLPRAGHKAWTRDADGVEYMFSKGKVYRCEWVDGKFAPVAI